MLTRSRSPSAFLRLDRAAFVSDFDFDVDLGRMCQNIRDLPLTESSGIKEKLFENIPGPPPPAAHVWGKNTPFSFDVGRLTLRGEAMCCALLSISNVAALNRKGFVMA